MRIHLCALGALFLFLFPRLGGAIDSDDLRSPSRLKLGVGDRMSFRVEGRWNFEASAARAYDLNLDLFEVWLTRGWQEDWVKRGNLLKLAKTGMTPVVMHYYFGDEISKERIEG